MPIYEYYLYNDQYIKKEEFALPFPNRAFLYGDAIFETIRANGTRIAFAEDHLIRSQHGLTSLKMEIPGFLKNKLSFEKKLRDLLNKSKLLKGARIRITFFREANGKYTPDKNTTGYLIEANSLEHDAFQLNKEGIHLGTYEEMEKCITPLSNLKSTNAHLYTLAGIFAKEKGFDDVIIYNDKGKIAECISSNIFLIKDKTIMTPPLSSGCVAGITRKQILKLADAMGFTIIYDQEVEEKHILMADEIFLTNTIKGVQWVKAYADKRFYNKKAQLFTDELNYLAFSY